MAKHFHSNIVGERYKVSKCWFSYSISKNSKHI